MRKFVIAASAVCVCCSPLLVNNAQADETDSAFSTDWSFGLQAAPLMFGLSLRRHINDIWQLQGVLTPDGENSTVGLRVLRTSTQKQYWRSYLFSGIAAARDSDYFYDNNNLDGVERKYTQAVITAGLGLEWAWSSKNVSRPPLSWSLELGLGLRNDDYNGTSYANDDGVFMVVGAGIHYQFE